jgi:methylenetetrahydrofolate--tRNA-(uracil-5-)-methyltransferase
MWDNADAVVIGGGFGGVEAAWALAEAGVRVALVEMRPCRMTPAHRTGDLAELVCSNSFKSDAPGTASHLLKDEMRRLGSLTMRVAEQARVPAGGALAVDRDVFARAVTEAIESHPNITLFRGELATPPEDVPAVVATGPLTAATFANSIAELTGQEHLYFFDAIAPTVEADSVDLDVVFTASRYGKGEGGYLNCPMTREQYYAFYDALMSAERHEGHVFDTLHLFEGCMPIEEMAARGPETLAHGPLKPVGLTDPRTGNRPYAVVQLRQENLDGTLYGLVGFQTRLKWGEQKRVFRMIPGLEKAEFVRYGSMHRNTYINSPTVLDATLRFRGPDKLLLPAPRDLGSILPPRGHEQPPAAARPHPAPLYFAGQITGVEGYVESAATGIVAGRALAAELAGRSMEPLPPETMLGALCHYVAWSDPRHFQPMNACFGIVPPIEMRAKKQLRHQALVERGLAALERWLKRQAAQTSR